MYELIPHISFDSLCECTSMCKTGPLTYHKTICNHSLNQTSMKFIKIIIMKINPVSS